MNKNQRNGVVPYRKKYHPARTAPTRLPACTPSVNKMVFGYLNTTGNRNVIGNVRKTVYMRNANNEVIKLSEVHNFINTTDRTNVRTGNGNPNTWRGGNRHGRNHR